MAIHCIVCFSCRPGISKVQAVIPSRQIEGSGAEFYLPDIKSSPGVPNSLILSGSYLVLIEVDKEYDIYTLVNGSNWRN